MVFSRLVGTILAVVSVRFSSCHVIISSSFFLLSSKTRWSPTTKPFGTPSRPKAGRTKAECFTPTSARAPSNGPSPCTCSRKKKPKTSPTYASGSEGAKFEKATGNSGVFVETDLSCKGK